MKTAKPFLTFVNRAPFQPVIAVGLRLGDAYFDRSVAELQTKRDLLASHLERAGFRVFTPEGAYFTTVDIRSVGATDSVEFCLSLPETAGVGCAEPANGWWTRSADEPGAGLVG